MKLGIMQPYFLPYIGYFQLIQAVDQFVIYDDVLWIKGGWVNRNRIQIKGQPQYITLPLRKDSRWCNINQREMAGDIELHKQKILRQVQMAYRRAPCFDSVYPMLTDILACRENNLCRFLVNALTVCCRHLDIHTPLVLSSELAIPSSLSGQERVLFINQLLGADHYINAIGGQMLYSREVFASQQLKLNFIQTTPVEYHQAHAGRFLPFLSILDVLMFNSPEETRSLLAAYQLV